MGTESRCKHSRRRIFKMELQLQTCNQATRRSPSRFRRRQSKSTWVSMRSRHRPKISSTKIRLPLNLLLLRGPPSLTRKQRESNQELLLSSRSRCLNRSTLDRKVRTVCPLWTAINRKIREECSTLLKTKKTWVKLCSRATALWKARLEWAETRLVSVAQARAASTT